MAAGYIIHKHQQNKRDKQRLEDEAAALEEEQYHIFPSEGRHSRPEHRRRRSHSRRRHSDERYDRYDRPHSHDGKYRRESPSPRPKPILKKPTNYSNPQLAPQMPPPYPAAVAAGLPPIAATAQRPIPQAQPQPQSQPQAQSYPQDVKYGWTDGQQQQRPPHDPNYPPTGWPSEWQQSHGASSSSRAPQQQRQAAESSRGRSERRPEDSPRVRFAAPRHSPSVRSLSQSPPPSYRA